MKKNRRIFTAILIVFFSLSFFTACTREERINVAELERRMAKYDENCSFLDGEVFYCKPTYYTYFSFESEQDVLLTVRHDKYGRVDRVTVTSDAGGSVEEDCRYALVCRCVAASLLPTGSDADAVLSSAGLFDEQCADAAGFSDFTVKKTSFWVFRNRGTVTFTADIS